jgi:hypothetical protein
MPMHFDTSVREPRGNARNPSAPARAASGLARPTCARGVPIGPDDQRAVTSGELASRSSQSRSTPAFRRPAGFDAVSGAQHEA